MSQMRQLPSQNRSKQPDIAQVFTQAPSGCEDGLGFLHSGREIHSIIRMLCCGNAVYKCDFIIIILGVNFFFPMKIGLNSGTPHKTVEIITTYFSLSVTKKTTTSRHYPALGWQHHDSSNPAVYLYTTSCLEVSEYPGKNSSPVSQGALPVLPVKTGLMSGCGVVGGCRQPCPAILIPLVSTPAPASSAACAQL